MRVVQNSRVQEGILFLLSVCIVGRGVCSLAEIVNEIDPECLRLVSEKRIREAKIPGSH